MSLLAPPAEPRGYKGQRRILAGLSEAQRRWEERTGSRLVVSAGPPYFRYAGGPDGARGKG